MNDINPILLIAILLGAVIQIAIVICFFVLCSHIAKLLREATVIRQQQIPALSQQLQQIHDRLGAIESGRAAALRQARQPSGT